MHVIVAHNGQGRFLAVLFKNLASHVATEETPLDRELQSKELARIMSSVYPEPLIYLGYVVTKPHAERRTSYSDSSAIFTLTESSEAAPYDIMVNDGRVLDIDKDDWDRW